MAKAKSKATPKTKASPKATSKSKPKTPPKAKLKETANSRSKPKPKAKSPRIKREIHRPDPFKEMFRDARAKAGIGRLAATRLLTLGMTKDISQSASEAVDQREQDHEIATAQKVTALPCLAMQALSYMKQNCGLAVEFAQIDMNGNIIHIPSLDEIRGVLRTHNHSLEMTDAGYDAFADFCTRNLKYNISWLHVISMALMKRGRFEDDALFTEQEVSITFPGSVTESGKDEIMELEKIYFKRV